MRIRGAKTEMEDAQLDTEGMATSTAKLQAEIKALSGVDIMKSRNEFKSTYDILRELSEVWADLSDIQQASIIELIAGKRQGNIVSALMSNFDIAEEAKLGAANSEGSAMAEYNKWLDSMEAHIQKLKLAFESLSQSAMSSDFLIGGMDAISSFVNILDKVIDKVGLLPTLFGAISAGMSFKNVGETSNQFPMLITLNIEYAHKTFY